MKKNAGIEKKVHMLNLTMENLAKRLNIGWIDNSNLDESCHGFSMLNLNKKGNAVFANNFLNLLNLIDSATSHFSRKISLIQANILGSLAIRMICLQETILTEQYIIPKAIIIQAIVFRRRKSFD